eukprot:scaffold3976_cov45-Cyclotella_meneghiniana.AAC.8
MPPLQDISDGMPCFTNLVFAAAIINEVKSGVGEPPLDTMDYMVIVRRTSWRIGSLYRQWFRIQLLDTGIFKRIGLSECLDTVS